MDCLACGSETLAFAVPEPYRAYVPDGEPGAALCRQCLSLQAVENPPVGVPNLAAVSDAIPDDSDAAIPLALMLGLLDSLATNRAAISELLGAVEEAGVDPLLVLDRLAADPDIDAAVDLHGRRRQLDQLL